MKYHIGLIPIIKLEIVIISQQILIGLHILIQVIIILEVIKVQILTLLLNGGLMLIQPIKDTI